MFLRYAVLFIISFILAIGESRYEVREYESPPSKPTWLRPKTFSQPPMRVNYNTARWITPVYTTESALPDKPPSRPGVRPPQPQGKPGKPLVSTRPKTTPRPNSARTTSRKSGSLRATTQRPRTFNRP